MEFQQVSLARKKFLETICRRKLSKPELLPQAEEGPLLLFSCLPYTNGAIDGGGYHAAVLWVVTHTCHLQNETRWITSSVYAPEKGSSSSRKMIDMNNISLSVHNSTYVLLSLLQR